MRICSLCCDVACTGFVCGKRKQARLADLLAHVRTVSELNELMRAEREDRELYTFYFQPKSIQPLLSRLGQPDLSQYIESTIVRPSGVIVHPKLGKDTAQAFLLAVLNTLDYDKSDVRLDTAPPFAQRINWVAYYSNGDPDAKSAFRNLLHERNWPNEYFDEDYIGYYEHHLDVPRAQ